MNEILERHINLLNSGVTTGDYTEMIKGFTENAEMHFEGINVGPFIGRDAIARAYRERPPDDQIIIIGEGKSEKPGLVVADYAWAKSPNLRAGEMRLKLEGDLISDLTISFAQQPA